MKLKMLSLCQVALLVTLSLSTGLALAQQAAIQPRSYQVVNLGTPLGGPFALAQTISLQGFVAGYASLQGDMTEHALLWNTNGTTDLGTLGGSNSAVLGNLSGYSETATPDPLNQDFCETGTHHVCLAFTLVNGKEVALPTLGGTAAAAYGNNSLGQVVGVSLTRAHDASCLTGGQPVAPAYRDPAGCTRGLAKWRGHQPPYVLRRLERKRECQQRPRSNHRRVRRLLQQPKCARPALEQRQGDQPRQPGRAMNQHSRSHQQPGSNYRRLRSGG